MATRGLATDGLEPGQTADNEVRIETRFLPAGVMAIAIAGELDVVTASQFEAALIAALERSPDGVVVDLTECDFIDSSVLAVLTNTRKRLDPKGNRIRLVVPDSHVRKVLEITHLDALFRTYTHVNSAVSGGTGQSSSVRRS